MTDRSIFEARDGLSGSLQAALLSTERPVPPDFAARATARFERAFARQRQGRLAVGIAAICLLSMLAAWSLILDTFGVSEAIRDGIISTVAFMESVMTVWSNLPVIGVLASLGMMALVLLDYGLLTKLGRGLR